MTQKTLFDLPQEKGVPLREQPRPKTAPKGERYYIFCEQNGKRLVLTWSFLKNDFDYRPLDELTFEPTLYHSWFEANHARLVYEFERDVSGLHVARWDETTLAKNAAVRKAGAK